mmetsp:Transcript_34957/g.77736  ORF Transcript_34957/g.77736 Transcript_34957/m.77736 type:complete len:202 (-) Transcript_34957:1519-2124(-)
MWRTAAHQQCIGGRKADHRRGGPPVPVPGAGLERGGHHARSCNLLWAARPAQKGLQERARRGARCAAQPGSRRTVCLHRPAGGLPPGDHQQAAAGFGAGPASCHVRHHRTGRPACSVQGCGRCHVAAGTHGVHLFWHVRAREGPAGEAGGGAGQRGGGARVRTPAQICGAAASGSSSGGNKRPQWRHMGRRRQCRWQCQLQ